MRVRILGSGTSLGVPVIGCDCRVCLSDDPRNKRLRSSVFVETEQQRILVDVTPDFRTQALRENIRAIDAVFMTHEHADHISGLDDLRVFGFHTRRPVPIYSNRVVKEFIEERFFYAFNPPQQGGGVPQLGLQLIEEPVVLGDVTVTPVPVYHGNMEILGFRFNDFGYVTDCSRMPDESKARLMDLDVLVLNALRRKPHPTHYSLDEAVAVARELRAGRTYFTHLTDKLEHEETNRSLPDSFELAYDGLVIEINSRSGEAPLPAQSDPKEQD
jgi:phosphoribosyl 1,2-cyclic phosphate phosphodiesterase